MVEEIGLQSKNQKQKMMAIRKALNKYGDIPSSVVSSSTRKPKEWVAIFDRQGNVLSAGRVVSTDWYSFTVKNLFTIPQARKKGLGKAIVRKLVQVATKRGAKVIVADITYNNLPSKKICLKLGFKVVSTFKWAKHEKPADILHFVLYPAKRKTGAKKSIRKKPSRRSSSVSLGFKGIGNYKVGKSLRIKL